MSSTSIPTRPTVHPAPTGHRAARIAVAASAASVIAIALAGFLDPGYSHLREGISALASQESRSAPIMTVGFFAMAATLIAAGVALFAALPGKKARAAAILIMIAGAITAVSGIFPQDCSSQEAACRVRESAETVSGSHVLHNLIAIPLFLFLVVAAFLLAAALRRMPAHRSYARASLLVGVAGLLLMVAFGADLAGDLGGLVQRVFVVLVYGWPVYLATRLTRTPR